MIKFVRGDSCLFKVKLALQGNETISMSDIDNIIITCRQYPDIESEVLFKKVKEDVTLDEDGYLHFNFKPEDTQTLAYGTYCFDIEITMTTGYRKSKMFRFELTDETTIHGGENGN